MVSAPQVSQTTAISKSTSSTDRLNALLPTVASEYSPLKVYIPGAATEINQLGGTATTPSSVGGGVWVAPDINGDGSAYTATIECLGAGGSGGGGQGRRASTPSIVANTNAATASTSLTISPPLPAGSSYIQGGTIVVAVTVPNLTAQTMTVTDAAGNSYSLLKSGNGSSGGTLFAFASFNIAKLSGNITITSTVSEVMCAMPVYLPDVHGLSSAGSTAAAAASVAANTAWPALSLNYNANDLVLAFAAANVAPPTTVSGDFTSLGANSKSTSTAQQISGWWTQRGGVPGSNGATLTPSTWNAGSNGAAATFALEMHIPLASSHVYGADLPGSGAGGGEYACEPDYPIVPGSAYSYFAANNTIPAYGSSDGIAGQPTVFDPNGKGLQGGVVANGGGAGKFSGSGGAPGTGSSNTIHYDGGSGGVSPAGVGSDLPSAYLAVVPKDLRVDLVLDDTSGSPQDLGINSLPTGVHQAAGAYIGPATGGVTAPPQVHPSGLTGTAAGTCWEFSKGSSQSNTGGIELMGTGPTGSTSTVVGGNNGGGNAWTTFAVSAWIKGHSTATSPTNWTSDASPSQAVIAGTANICQPGGGLAPRGFSLYLDVTSSSLGGILNFGYGESATTSSHPYTMSAPSNPISATDGKWHHVMFINKGTVGSAMYIDGVLVNSSSTYVGQTSNGWLANGSNNLTLGYLRTRGDRCYKGYMASFWMGNNDIPKVVGTETPATSTAPSYIFGLSTTTGGAGGGSSAGSAGPGTAGSNGAGSSGGAGGVSSNSALTPYLIAGASGTAGNNSGTANSWSPSANGSGGGGAGSAGSNSASVYTVEVPVQASATYTGIDSASPGSIYSTSDSEFQESGTSAPTGVATGESLCIAGGKPEDPSNGTMNSVLQFPYLGNQLAVDGTPLFTTYNKWQVIRAVLSLTINTTQASVVGFSVAGPSGALPDELTDTELAAWDTVAVNQPYSAVTTQYDQYFYVPAGAQGRVVSFDVPANIIGNSGNPTDIIIGTLSGSSLHDFGVGGYTSDEAADWYCEFFGSGTDGGAQDATLAIEYALLNNASALSVNASNGGGAGRIAITIPDPEGNPITTILPTAATDTQGNALAAGITTEAISTWQPGSSPLTLEYTHYVGNAGERPFNSGWSNSATTTAMRFRLMPDGEVTISGQVKNSASISGNQIIFTLPSGYYSATHNVYFMGTTGTGVLTSYLAIIDTSGNFQLYNLPGGGAIPANTAFSFNVSYTITD